MRRVKKSGTQICSHHSDCFAHCNGICLILYDTYFHGKDCPFYKTPDKIKEECEKSKERLKSIGCEDLIEHKRKDTDTRYDNK